MRDLPRRVHLNRGRYFYVFTVDGKATWRPLTRERKSSLAMAEAIEAGRLGTRDVAALKRKLRKCWTAARWRAKKYEIEFSLDWDDLVAKAEKQGWCCALTAFPFTLHTDGKAAGPLGPSIDRLSNEQGYLPDNVRLICVAANYALNEWGDSFFERLATAFLAAKGKKT